MQKCNYRSTLCFNCRFVDLLLPAALLASSPSPLPRRKQMAISTEEPSQFGIAWHFVLAMERAELAVRRRAPRDRRPLPVTAAQ